MTAWAPAIQLCLPIALDLANNEWGHHDTYAYVCSGFKLFAFSDSNPTRSLTLITEPTGLDEGYLSYRVGKSHIARHSCIKSDSPTTAYFCCRCSMQGSVALRTCSQSGQTSNIRQTTRQTDCRTSAVTASSETSIPPMFFMPELKCGACLASESDATRIKSAPARLPSWPSLNY